MANDKPFSSVRRAKKLKITGVIVLVLGVVSAGIVYWLGTRSLNLNDDVSMLGFDKAKSRQMAQLYGKSGLLIENWLNDLKQPGTQAIIILVFSALVAYGCFYFARLLDSDDEKAGNKLNEQSSNESN
jgi:hypothetical protein